MHDPDRALVERTLAGDLGAFETLVERHQGVAYRIAARIAGPDDAEDITQDAFLRAFHRLSRFRAEGSFRAWLLQIVHNTAQNVRAGRRFEPREEVESLVEAAADAVERTPAERLVDRERLDSKGCDDVWTYISLPPDAADNPGGADVLEPQRPVGAAPARLCPGVLQRRRCGLLPGSRSAGRRIVITPARAGGLLVNFGVN